MARDAEIPFILKLVHYITLLLCESGGVGEGTGLGDIRGSDCFLCYSGSPFHLCYLIFFLAWIV